MNKIAIPTLLLGVVMIAGAFAFMPVQEASTVHTGGLTTINTLEHLNVSVTNGGVTVGDTPLWTLANGEDTEVYYVTVTDGAGVAVTTLIAADFTGLATPIGGSPAATLVFTAEVGSGVYSMTLDAADLGAAGFIDYLLTVTVDDLNNDDTTEAGVASMHANLEILA